MVSRLRFALTILLGRQRGSMSLVPRESDVYLVSYPKSGNTWLRFLVGNLADPENPIGFANLEKRVPDIYRNLASRLEAMPNPRWLKSHEPYVPNYRRVVYLARDPRAVVVSYYYHQVKFGKMAHDYPLDRFTERFVQGKVDPYGPWGEHVMSWIGARQGTKGFLLIRYEDLHSDPREELDRIASFLDLERSSAQLKVVVDNSAFHSMRKAEELEGDEWDPIRGTSDSIRFIRSGKVGGWRSVLPSESSSLIASAWPKAMSVLGYDGDPRNTRG